MNYDEIAEPMREILRAIIEAFGAWFGMPVSDGRRALSRWTVIATLVAIFVMAFWLAL